MKQKIHTKLDLLAYAAHPDDIEISASGILLSHKAQGLSIGIIDLTAGELGTRGNSVLRAKESEAASHILGLDVRENLQLQDGFFEINESSLLQVIGSLRKYQPEIVLINSESDRHPDHGRAHELLKRASFLSGLPKIQTFLEGKEQIPWRPRAIYSYIQDYYLEPDLVVDVTNFWEKRMQALMAYSSQFYSPDSAEPQTPISTPDFLHFIEGRARQFGRYIQVTYGEGLRKVRPVGIHSLKDLY